MCSLSDMAHIGAMRRQVNRREHLGSETGHDPDPTSFIEVRGQRYGIGHSLSGLTAILRARQAKLISINSRLIDFIKIALYRQESPSLVHIDIVLLSSSSECDSEDTLEA